MSNMNELRLEPDDPRLTAYALDELEGEERVRIAEAVAADPALQAVVDEIRGAAGRLTDALKEEPLPDPVRPFHVEPYHTVRPPRMFPFPYWAVSALAAAACLVVLFALRQLPFAGDGRLGKSGQAADAGGAKDVDGRLVAGRQQASNQVDIVFPTAPGDAAAATTGGVGDQFGVVVPNAPSTSTDPTQAKDVADGAATAAKTAVASATAASGSRLLADAGPAGAVPDNAFLQATQNPVSGFSVDTGASSYADVRRSLLDGRRPSRAAVRLEELVNYFRYDYAVPEPEAREPIAASLEVASAPWEPRHRLVRIALKARDLPAGGRGSIVARDVAVQVEFSPAQVQAYRLLGYENPGPAGGRRGGGTADVPDIRPGQSITAFYEVVPASESPVSQRLLTVTVRYRMPDGGASRSLEFPLVDKGAAFADASRDFKFAAAVAEFGLVLRDSPYKAGASMADVLHWAEQAAGADPDGHRGEFIALVKRAGTVLASQG